MQGKDASSAWMRVQCGGRAARPLRCLPAATARRDSRMAARSVTVADRAGGAFPAYVCAHTVAHRSWCLTPGRSALPTKIRTPVTGVFRSSGADGSMLPRVPSSEGPSGACQATASRASASLPADARPRRLQGAQRPNYAARTHETRHRAFCCDDRPGARPTSRPRSALWCAMPPAGARPCRHGAVVQIFLNRITPTMSAGGQGRG